MATAVSDVQAPGRAAHVARIPELDGVRGVAILLVVFAHAMSGIGGRALMPALDSMGGLAGVQLFFVLSGYLITRLLLAERERTGSIDLFAFYRRRLSRLYPSLLLVAACVAALDPWSAFRAVTYSSNWLGGEHGRGILGHSWSLSVEEQFYLAWPALLLLSGRRAAWVAALGVAVTLLAQQTVDWSPRGIYYGLRWDALLAGCLLAMTAVRGSGRLLAVGLAVLASFALGGFGELRPSFYPLATAASVCVVVSACGVPWLASRWLVHVGRLSYAWYLWHGVTMRADLPVWLTVPASLGLAELTYRLVDKQAQTRRAVPQLSSSPIHAPTA